jgi:hypothetical protein
VNSVHSVRKLGIGLVAVAAVTVPLFTTAAASASPAATRPTIFSAEQAGAAIGAPRVQYRYVETTFTLPDSSKLPYTTGGGISVQLRSNDDTFVLGISATPGSQWNAAAVDLQPGNCTSGSCIFYSNANSPQMNSGDSITLSAYRNYSNGFIYYTAQDNTSGAVFSARFADPGSAFSSARVGAEFATFPAGTPGSSFTSPAKDFRLVLLSGTKVTQKNGTHVSLVKSSQVVETSDGTKNGTVQVNAPTVYNNGMNTGIWVRH